MRANVSRSSAMDRSPILPTLILFPGPGDQSAPQLDRDGRSGLDNPLTYHPNVNYYNDNDPYVCQWIGNLIEGG